VYRDTQCMRYDTDPVVRMIRYGLQAKGSGVPPGDQVRLPKAACGKSRIRKHAPSDV